MLDQKQMMQAIYDKIYDTLTIGPSGRPATFDRKTTLLSLRIPGVGIEPEVYANPFSPANPDGSHSAAAKLAEIADTVPVLSPIYNPSGQSIEDLYGQLVRAEVDAQQETEQQKNNRERFEKLLFVDSKDYDEDGIPIIVPNGADSPIVTRYKNGRKNFRKALTEYQNQFLQLDLTKAEDKRRWAILGPGYEADLDAAWQDFQATQPGRIEEAQNWLGQEGQSSAATLFSEARLLFTEKTKFANPDRPGTFYHISSFSPGNWFAKKTPDYFTDVTITQNSMATSSDSRFGSWGGGGGVDFGLFAISASASGSWSSYNASTDTSDLRISFRFAVVDMFRYWMRQSLFSFNNYSLNGREKNYFSNGKLDASNTGLLPLIPQSLIVYGDVQISARWGHTEVEKIESARRGGGGFRIGPFSIGGSGGSSSSSSRFRATFDGTTVTLPGSYIGGYISQLNPASPPKDG